MGPYTTHRVATRTPRTRRLARAARDAVTLTSRRNPSCGLGRDRSECDTLLSRRAFQLVLPVHNFSNTSGVVIQTEVTQRLYKRVRATEIDVTSTSGPSSSAFARPFVILRRKHSTSLTLRICALRNCSDVALAHHHT